MHLEVELVHNNMATRQNGFRLYLDVIGDPADNNHNIASAKASVLRNMVDNPC